MAHWLSLYSLSTNKQKRDRERYCFQQFLHCCMCISFCRNVFTQALPHTGKCNYVTICYWHIKNHSSSSLSTSNCTRKLGQTSELNWHLQCEGYISHTTRNRVKLHCSLWSSPRTQTTPRILVRQPLDWCLSFKYVSLEILRCEISNALQLQALPACFTSTHKQKSYNEWTTISARILVITNEI